MTYEANVYQVHVNQIYKSVYPKAERSRTPCILIIYIRLYAEPHVYDNSIAHEEKPIYFRYTNYEARVHSVHAYLLCNCVYPKVEGSRSPCILIVFIQLYAEAHVYDDSSNREQKPIYFGYTNYEARAH